MTEDLLTRARELAVYIIETRTTIRQAAKHFGLSKSTVHKDLAERLPAANHALYAAVREILDENKAERHIRGGLATRKNTRDTELLVFTGLFPASGEGPALFVQTAKNL